MRAPGFYWVNSEGIWEIAEWSIGPRGGAWFITGRDFTADDDWWQQIDERRIERLESE